MKDDSEMSEGEERELSWRRTEIAAIQEGIDAMEAGQVRPLRDFDAEYRAAWRK
jgi:hypothetical protein